MKKLLSLFTALPLVAILMFSTFVFAGTGDIVVEGKPVTGKIEVGGGTLELPNSNTLPGTCAVGDTYILTSAVSGLRYYICESTNVWTPQGSFYGAAYFSDYNEADQGVTGNGKSTKAYIDTISTDSATLVFRHNSGAATTTYTFETSETVPSNINIIIEKGAILSIAAAQTLTVNSPFDAGLYQAFSGDGKAVFDSVLEVYPEWWGAKADNSSASAATNTTAIHAAIATQRKVKFSSGTYYHNGIVITDVTCNEAHLKGSGMMETVLRCTDAGVDNISISSVDAYYHYLTIADMKISGDDTNGNGIYGNGIIWFTFENLFILHNGEHGIHLTDTGTPSSGSYIGSIKNSKICYNVGDGIYQVATGGGNQENATHIQNVESQGNANGMTLWGANLSVRDCTIEANDSKGIRIQNFGVSPIYSAYNMVVDGCYFEGNPDGHIYGYFNSTTHGIITGLEITNNYGHQNITVPGVGYKSVFLESLLAADQIRGLLYRNNNFLFAGGTPTVIADFGGWLSSNSQVSVSYYSYSSDYGDIISQYVKFGLANVDFVKSFIPQGYWLAKGGSNINYIELKRTMNMTTFPADTYFPLGSIPLMSRLTRMGIYVSSNATNYSVRMDIRRANQEDDGNYANVASHTSSGLSGNNYVEFNLIGNAGANVIPGNNDLILYIKVEMVTAGTTLKLGNPIVYYR